MISCLNIIRTEYIMAYCVSYNILRIYGVIRKWHPLVLSAAR